MNNTFTITTIGDATLDTFLDIHEASVHCDVNKKKCQLCFNYADKIPIHDARQSIGGDAANVAAGLKKLDQTTAIVTELGNDVNGNYIAEELDEAGVNTDYIRMVQGAITRYSVVLTYQGERTILAYHPKQKYTTFTIPKSTAWIYFTSLGQGSEKIQDAVSKYVKKNPKTMLATNPGSYQLRDGLSYYKKIIPQSEVIFLNREEAEIIVGKNNNTKKLIKTVGALGPKIVVITDGERGSYAFDGTHVYHHNNYPVQVVSKTGAGDAYASGFLGAVIAKKDVPTAMQWGTANAAGVIQKYGAQAGLLNPTAIKKMIQHYSSIKSEII